MKELRKLIREEITSMANDEGCSLKDWLGILNYVEEKELENSELQINLAQIQDATESGESNDYILSRINTIILGWTKMKEENL